MRGFFRPINGIQWLTLILIACVAVGFTYGFSALSSTQAHENDALRSIMCYAQHVVKVRPGIPPKQRHAALRFYKRAIADAHLNPCP